MRRMKGAWMLVALVAGCVPAGAEIGGMPSISADMVPDPAYRPRVGDRAVLYALVDGSPLDRVPLLRDVTAYDLYVRSQKARDDERLHELEEQGWLQWAAPGTRVSVLAIQDRNHTGAHTASQVHVSDDGPKGQDFWTPSDFIARLIRKEPE